MFKRQRGYIAISNTGLFVALAVVAVLGWAVIEFACWALSHLSVSVVG